MMTQKITHTLKIDHREYLLEVIQRTSMPLTAPRLVIPAYLLSHQASLVLRVCLQSIKRYTLQPHEIWVIDNNSPPQYSNWLRDDLTINLVYNRTEPLPPGVTSRDQFMAWLRHRPGQLNWGSYANALGLEIGKRLVSPNIRYIMTLHMDTMACHPSWLTFLQTRLSDQVAAAGVRMDTERSPQGVLHILGCLFDFQRLIQMDVDFFPDLPRYDVGDRISHALRNAGYQLFSCKNTRKQPELISLIPSDSPFKYFAVERFLDDENQVIFAHLGRAVQKSARNENAGISMNDWIRFAQQERLV